MNSNHFLNNKSIAFFSTPPPCFLWSSLIFVSKLFFVSRPVNTIRPFNAYDENKEISPGDYIIVLRSLGTNQSRSCPKCQHFSQRKDSSNSIKCDFCRTHWCLICRQYFKGSKSIEQHFYIYNVFGCPGLRNSPSSYLIVNLLLNLLFALCFPVTLIFTPMVVMFRNYQGASLVSDQAKRLRTKTTPYFHLNIA